MVYRGPGFLAVAWPIELTCGKGGQGWGTSQIILVLVLQKSINTLCSSKKFKSVSFMLTKEGQKSGCLIWTMALMQRHYQAWRGNNKIILNSYYSESLVILTVFWFLVKINANSKSSLPSNWSLRTKSAKL